LSDRDSLGGDRSSKHLLLQSSKVSGSSDVALSEVWDPEVPILMCHDPLYWRGAAERTIASCDFAVDGPALAWPALAMPC
jgi:hypothetical protein